MRTTAPYACLFTAALILLSASSASAARAEWVKTHQWSGSGTVATETFRVTGAKWRVRYDPKGVGTFAISVLDLTGQDVGRAAATGELARGWRTFRGTGEHLLRIAGSANVSWTVSVEQYLTVIEEWNLRQWMKREGRISLSPVASWTGQDADMAYKVAVVVPGWNVRCTNRGAGVLKLSVVDSAGRTQMRARLDGVGTMAGWGYRAGTYELRIEAEDTDWQVEVGELASAPRVKLGPTPAPVAAPSVPSAPPATAAPERVPAPVPVASPEPVELLPPRVIPAENTD